MRAFERAVAAGDREGVATRELARLYRDSGLAGKAAECYYRHLQLTGGATLAAAVQGVVMGTPTSAEGQGLALGLTAEGQGLPAASSQHLDALIGSVEEEVDAERAEALLYLARLGEDCLLFRHTHTHTQTNTHTQTLSIHLINTQSIHLTNPLSPPPPPPPSRHLLYYQLLQGTRTVGTGRVAVCTTHGQGKAYTHPVHTLCYHTFLTHYVNTSN